MIAPYIHSMLLETQLTSEERALLLDQFHNLEPQEELAWLKFLQEQPGFFKSVGSQVRKLGNALLFNDIKYLEELRKQALSDSLVLGS